jgi:uncharacterized repeat protein (TIGR01451 family)
VAPTISIVKAVDVPFAREGEQIEYLLTVHNFSSEPISGIFVTDTIPDSSSFVTGSIVGGGTYDAQYDLVRWSITTLDPGADAQLVFRVLLDGPFTDDTTVVSNQAFAVYDVPTIAAAARTYASNIVETLVEKAEPTGIVSITKDVSATLASPGDELTYTITVRNEEPVEATSVVIFDAPPNRTAYVGASLGGQHDPRTDSVFWNLGPLAPGATRSVTFRVNVDSDCPDGTMIPNTALVRYVLNGRRYAEQSRQVITAISVEPMVIRKTVNRPSGMLGEMFRFSITIQNFSGQPFDDMILLDTMPNGIYVVDGTARLNGTALANPTGDNPYEWALGDLPASGTFTVEYVGLIGAAAAPGLHENVARARATQGGLPVHSNRAAVNVFVLSQQLTGSIRGRVIVDCDGDGMAEMDSVPSGMDVYLDDGSQSKVNEKGMFYFSTVRAGERVVALDERDLHGYFVPDDAQASVFVHVHETGESYVIFRICPDYPHLDINKEAAIVPTVKVTKTAKLNPKPVTDSLGVLIDYQIDIKSNGLADPTQVRVVDSFPENTHLILAEAEKIAPRRDGDQLVYEVTAAQERLEKSVYYSLRDLTPGMRRFLANKVHVEGDLARAGEEIRTTSSEPVEVAAGPFLLAPPQDVKVILTPALFITSKADLQEPAIPQLHAVADSIVKYADADVKVEGHTDLRPIHTREFPSNWELGEARAKSVVDWLVENRDVERDRLVYESFAATRPVVVDVPRTSEALQPNRRTEVIIQAKLGGFVDPTVLTTDEWQSSTSLALEPVVFDTLFEPAPVPMETGLDGSWEVVLTISNTSVLAAINAPLSDLLPEGVEYVEGSARLDSQSVTAVVESGALNVLLPLVEPGQTLELRYRIVALEGQIPSGGGAASVEVTTSADQPVVQKSNEVRFE